MGVTGDGDTHRFSPVRELVGLGKSRPCHRAESLLQNFVMMEGFLCDGHLSTWDVTDTSKELDFKFPLVLTNLNLNSSCG
jgi:hypothetical protein